jgi:hypothetical protein
VVRSAALLAVAAAAALGILSALPAGGPSVVQRAEAALQSSDDSILHYQVNAVQQNGDGTSAAWTQETWQLRVPPYTRRQIAIEAGVPRAESLTRRPQRALRRGQRHHLHRDEQAGAGGPDADDRDRVQGQAREAHREFEGVRGL